MMALPHAMGRTRWTAPAVGGGKVTAVARGSVPSKVKRVRPAAVRTRPGRRVLGNNVIRVNFSMKRRRVAAVIAEPAVDEGRAGSATHLVFGPGTNTETALGAVGTASTNRCFAVDAGEGKGTATATAAARGGCGPGTARCRVIASGRQRRPPIRGRIWVRPATKEPHS